MYCTKCGAEGHEGGFFCAQCGNPLSLQAATALSDRDCTKPDNINPQLVELAKRLGRVAVQQGRHREAAAQFTDALKDLPTDAEGWRLLGACHVALREPDKAIEAFRKAAQLAPQVGDTWGFLGNQYVAIGRLDEAVRALVEAIRLNPQDAIAWADLGDAYLRKGEPKRAVQALEEALRLKQPAQAGRIGNAARKALWRVLLRDARKACAGT